MAQVLVSKRINVLEKAGKKGTDLIIDWLFGWKGVTEIAREVRELGFRTTDSNVRKLLDKYMADFEDKKPKGTELITRHMVTTRLSEIKSEFQQVMLQDPVLVLHKNIYELEQMKSKNNDFRSAGSILELQSKFAGQLAKLMPLENVKVDINKLLSRSDLGVSFIIQMDLRHPELKLKAEFLEYIQAHVDDD